MPRSRLALIALVVLLVGVGAGYWIAESRGPRAFARPARGPAPPGETAAAIRAALTDPDRLRGTAALAETLHAASPEALPEIRAAYDSIFLDTSEVEVALLAEWWAAFDPEGAFAWSQQSRVAYQAMVIHPILRVWARHDPDAARAALFRILDPVTRRSCLDALVSGWDESGEPGLLAFLRGIPPGVEALIALNPIARRRVLQDGPEGAFAWAEALPDDEPGNVIEFKLQIFRRVASAAASVDAPKAAVWAAKHADGPHGAGLLGRVGNAWTMYDGPAAMAWLESLPPGASRDDGVEDTYRSWLRWNREEALAWMERASESPARWLEPALSMYAIVVGRKDPTRGIDLAMRITDTTWRDKALAGVVRRWRHDAPDAANTWMATAQISPELRQMIDYQPRAQRRQPSRDDGPIDWISDERRRHYRY